MQIGGTVNGTRCMVRSQTRWSRIYMLSRGVGTKSSYTVWELRGVICGPSGSVFLGPLLRTRLGLSLFLHCLSPVTGSLILREGTSPCFHWGPCRRPSLLVPLLQRVRPWGGPGCLQTCAHLQGHPKHAGSRGHRWPNPPRTGRGDATQMCWPRSLSELRVVGKLSKGFVNCTQEALNTA